MIMNAFCLVMVILQVTSAYQLSVTQEFSPTLNEVRICTAYKLDDDITYHLRQFEPYSSDPAVHHMIMGVCDDVGTDVKYWNCEDRPGMVKVEPSVPLHDSCKDHGMLALYLRGYKAGPLTLPEGHAFEVGKGTKNKYLILQAHYGNITVGAKYKAQVTVTYDIKPRSNTTTMPFDIANDNLSIVLPPHEKTFVEAYLELPFEFHPMFYLLHTHTLGKNVSTYYVKRRSTPDGLDTWIELGKRDPRLPQDYILVENDVTVHVGDGIATRCTFFNDRDEQASIGTRKVDEMCDVHLTSWFDAGNEDIVNSLPDAHTWRSWSDVGLNNIPEDA